ncbi:PilZ domain-containing protein [uncultured Aliiroseovarius sp.]|uniref:PilZ domain-containing protein n=1 Tax=uncultured Aliiroseovarius sp. TaxID=1658783 RepID=UPI0025975D6F|nr:PilZ domain-containing protein [uncultured Aliiroseovarius sp.]
MALTYALIDMTCLVQRNLLAALLTCYLLAAGTSAVSQPNNLCEYTSELTRIQQASALSQSISGAVHVVSILDNLVMKLEAIEDMNANSTLARVRRGLSNVVQKAEHNANATQHNSNIDRSVLYHALSAQMNNIILIEGMFGCGDGAGAKRIGDAKSRGKLGRLTTVNWSGPSALPISLMGFTLPFIIALTALQTPLLYKLLRKDVRKICRTPILVVYGDQCTVSHIVDISQAGMKIEAPGKDPKGTRVDLYFCGHKISGDIVWRNTFFAGIKFRHRMGQKALNDAINTSHKTLGESGLDQRATPCFYVGCHVRCPKHLPTSISEI